MAICAATGFALNFAFYGTVFVLTLSLFQEARGAAPLMAGLMYLPMTALVMATNLLEELAPPTATAHGPR